MRVKISEAEDMICLWLQHSIHVRHTIANRFALEHWVNLTIPAPVVLVISCSVMRHHVTVSLNHRLFFGHCLTAKPTS